ncbi:coiled-coil domain-containing protein 9B isoform X2 [Astyanax mexicanus]|uniref:coiled-coil domain-containing protein 9B isoform X2 n=1 Tax=Astyanax mexicanus TaxID=7994 RepID=UPI0020CADE06|nr:coiled-coil domain-containing protein 9B isoform X2 [Astyanax mexicanus]
MDRDSPTDMMLLKKEQKDAELDKKIEALRKKNEALMKRYQEVEEDKKRAEQEGMALQSRKGKVEDLTITINKSPTEKRVVTKKGSGGLSPKVQQDQGEERPGNFSGGRGKRRHLLVTMPGNIKGKRVVSERVDGNSPPGSSGVKYPSEEKDEVQEASAGGRNCVNTRRNTGNQQTEVSDALHPSDLDTPTSSEEQLEYLRWKKEREEIDRERVARHKNSQGQWRRAWDMDKPELMFSEKGAAERGAAGRGGRSSKRGHLRSSPAESRGNSARHREKREKNVPVVGSKAKGKDRLTGRARRWDAKVEEDQLQACPDTSLEEFLEELDALCDSEFDSSSPQTETQNGFRLSVGACADLRSELPEHHHPPESANTESPGTKSTEKKVRFSEDLIQGAYEKNTTNTGLTDTKASSLKSTSQTKTAAEEKEEAQQTSDQNQDCIKNTQEQETRAILPSEDQSRTSGQEDEQDTPVEEHPETESGHKEVADHSIGSQNACDASKHDSTEEELFHPVERLKSSTSRSTEELIDSSLSVLSLESGEPLPDHSTSTEKARENGKIV